MLAFPADWPCRACSHSMMNASSLPKARGARMSSDHLGLFTQKAGTWSSLLDPQHPQFCDYSDRTCDLGYFFRCLLIHQ